MGEPNEQKPSRSRRACPTQTTFELFEHNRLAYAYLGVDPDQARPRPWTPLVDVAIIDGDFNLEHPTLQRYEHIIQHAPRHHSAASSPPAWTTNTRAHGTKLVSVLIGDKDHRPGYERSVFGIARGYARLQLWPIGSPSLEDEEIGDALERAHAAGAQLILLAHNVEDEVSAQTQERLRLKVEQLMARRPVKIICSAGNTLGQAPLFPANIPGITSVGALNFVDGRWSPHERCRRGEFFSPGITINSASHCNDEYSTMSHTSLASCLYTGLLTRT